MTIGIAKISYGISYSNNGTTIYQEIYIRTIYTAVAVAGIIIFGPAAIKVISEIIGVVGIGNVTFA